MITLEDTTETDDMEEQLKYDRISFLEEAGEFENAKELVIEFPCTEEMLVAYSKNIANLGKGLAKIRPPVLQPEAHEYFIPGYIRSDDGLFEAMHKDYKRLQTHGVAVKDIADRLDDVCVKAHWQFMENPQQENYTVDEMFEVEVAEMKMTEQCPFDEERFAATRYNIKNIHTGESVAVDGMTSHLIREHMLFRRKAEENINAQQVFDVLYIAQCYADCTEV